MSSPIAPTFLRGATASEIDTTPSFSSQTSAFTTASAPSGIGAPVMMRTACPRSTRPSKGEPGNERPTTSSRIGS